MYLFQPASSTHVYAELLGACVQASRTMSNRPPARLAAEVFEAAQMHDIALTHLRAMPLNTDGTASAAALPAAALAPLPAPPPPLRRAASDYAVTPVSVGTSASSAIPSAFKRLAEASRKHHNPLAQSPARAAPQFAAVGTGNSRPFCPAAIASQPLPGERALFQPPQAPNVQPSMAGHPSLPAVRLHDVVHVHGILAAISPIATTAGAGPPGTAIAPGAYFLAELAAWRASAHVPAGCATSPAACPSEEEPSLAPPRAVLPCRLFVFFHVARSPAPPPGAGFGVLGWYPYLLVGRRFLFTDLVRAPPDATVGNGGSGAVTGERLVDVPVLVSGAPGCAVLWASVATRIVRWGEAAERLVVDALADVEDAVAPATSAATCAPRHGLPTSTDLSTTTLGDEALADAGALAEPPDSPEVVVASSQPLEGPDRSVDNAGSACSLALHLEDPSPREFAPQGGLASPILPPNIVIPATPATPVPGTSRGTAYRGDSPVADGVWTIGLPVLGANPTATPKPSPAAGVPGMPIVQPARARPDLFPYYAPADGIGRRGDPEGDSEACSNINSEGEWCVAGGGRDTCRYGTQAARVVTYRGVVSGHQRPSVLMLDGGRCALVYGTTGLPHNGRGLVRPGAVVRVHCAHVLAAPSGTQTRTGDPENAPGRRPTLWLGLCARSHVEVCAMGCTVGSELLRSTSE